MSATTLESPTAWVPRASVASDEWAQIPMTGTLCGLKRGKLRLLCVASPENQHKPPIKSSSLKRKNKKTGVRLINVTQLRDYIAFLSAQQEIEDAELAAADGGGQA